MGNTFRRRFDGKTFGSVTDESEAEEQDGREGCRQSGKEACWQEEG
jgi:hypothetical protein